ncbi:hypothetical protein [Pseudomonas sp. PS02290]|uniref:hypothetical protein n=1 Tax=Pseudomonas sp. PS02290 TaxID=2991430 RepID=UPI00249C5BFE|nr:hypothetical protein [Pseudomonas sp. PS02290]
MKPQNQPEVGKPLSLSDLSPELKAAVLISTIKPYSMLGEQAVIEDVKHQIGLVLAGDLSRPQAMLAGHAEALDALFYSLLSQAQRATEPESLAALIGSAVKAQEGCRSAVEGLATLKRFVHPGP